MGLMLSVLIFCVGVIEAIAWTAYLRHTCMPCSYHRQIHSKRLWTSRKSLSKMRSNSEEYALHHEAKCICSDVRKVDISWPRSFSLDICIKDGHNSCTAGKVTENDDEKMSTLPTHPSSNTFPPLMKRDSNASEHSIEELEEIDIKDDSFPPLVRQYSEDSWSAKKRNDSENSIESFDGFKTSKVNICWPRPFTPEDLRVIKKRNRSDSEQSVDEVEEMLGEPRLRPPNVLRVIRSRSHSDNESSDDGETIENENSHYITVCDIGSVQRDCDTEVSNIFLKPECKLELKRNNCNVFGNCSNVIGTHEVNACLSCGLPEIPETDAFVSDMSEDEGIKEDLMNNNSDFFICPIQRDRLSHENDREFDDLQAENNQKDSVTCGSVESEVIADNDISTSIAYSDIKLLGTLEMPKEGLKQLSEYSDVASKTMANVYISELPSIDGPPTEVTSADACSENYGSIQYEMPVQENRRERKEVSEESSETMIHRIVPNVEETNEIPAETLDSRGSFGSNDHLNSENSEGDELSYVKSDRVGSESEESEDNDGDTGSSRNNDVFSGTTESDCEHSEIAEKEYVSVYEAAECLRTESDIPSSCCHIEAKSNDELVCLCKAKESKEPDFEGSERVCKSNTVILNAVLPELGEQNENFQKLDKKDVGLRGGIEATCSESCRQGNQNIKATEELVETAQSEVDKAFWLIFSGEYTKAMSKDWHSGHFCCWQCDESLTGQRYVLRDDHPYCVKCYESVFANGCEECSKIIGIDSKDLSYKDKHWHEACFLCNKCRVSLVDKQFGSKVDKIYCGNCYDQQFASRCDGCGQIFRAE